MSLGRIKQWPHDYMQHKFVTFPTFFLSYSAAVLDIQVQCTDCNVFNANMNHWFFQDAFRTTQDKQQ